MATENPDFGSQRRVMVTGAFYSFAALVAVRMLTVVRAVAIARILGRSQLGFLTVLNQVVDTVSALAGFGITIAMTKFIAEHASQSRDRLGNTIKTCLMTMSVSLVIACAVLFGFASLLAQSFYHDAKYAILFRLAAVIFAVQSLYTFGQGVLQGLKEIRARSLTDIISVAVGVPAVILLTAVARITGAVIGQLILVVAGLVVVSLILFRVSRALPPISTWRFDRAFLPELANLSLPSFLSGLAMTPAVLITTNLLFQTGGSAKTGLFSVALTMFSLVLFVPIAVGMPLVPIIAEIHAGAQERLQRLTSVALDVVGFLVLLTTCLATVLAPLIVHILYGPQFSSSWYPVAVMSGAAFLSSLGLIAGNYVLGIGRAWAGLLFNAVWFVAIVGSSLLLVRTHGEIGLAYSWWIAYLLETAAVMFYLGFKARLPLGYALGLCGISIAMTVLSPLVYSRTQGILRIGLEFGLLGASCAAGYLLLPAKSELHSVVRSALQSLARIAIHPRHGPVAP
jgi:O-antigen/teichoic acid export membrane protein